MRVNKLYNTVRALLLLFLTGFGMAAKTQTYSAQPIPYTPYAYNSGVVFTVPDDQYSTVIPIGFSFTFYGNTYSQLLISSNGYVTFDTSYDSQYSPWPIDSSMPDTSYASPKNAIMGPWQDLYNPAGGNIYYTVTGTAPNRVFIASYDSLALFQCNSLHTTCQIVLHETTNLIDVFIGHMDNCATWNGSKAIEGVVNASGNNATIVPGRNASDSGWNANNDGYRFSPCATATPTDTITGMVYADLNGNCIFDGADYGLAHQLVMAGTCYATYTDNNGNYTLITDAGSYTVTHAVAGGMTAACPAGNAIPVAFAGGMMSSGGNDFGDAFAAGCTDISMNIGTWNLRKCGPNEYSVYYCNSGATAVSSLQLDVTLPDSMYITASDVAATSVVGNDYTFTLSGLAAGSCAIFHFTDSVDCNVAVGSYKCIAAVISGNPDCDLSNNSANDCHTIVYSYDPNFVVVAANNAAYVTGQTIQSTDSLTYQINFQNTGTGMAQNIVVRDTLPTSLQYSTVVPVMSSHVASFSNNNGVLTWTLSNINLPDSGSNEAASHAFVRFKVKQQAGNAPGTIIPNRAGIYFDANPVVATNSAIDTLDMNPTGIGNVTMGSLQVYPNPTHGDVTIRYAGTIKAGVVSVYNEVGVLVYSTTLQGNSAVIDTHSWAKGVYLMRLNAAGAAVTAKPLLVQ